MICNNLTFLCFCDGLTAENLPYCALRYCYRHLKMDSQKWIYIDKV